MTAAEERKVVFLLPVLTATAKYDAGTPASTLEISHQPYTVLLQQFSADGTPTSVFLPTNRRFTNNYPYIRLCLPSTCFLVFKVDAVLQNSPPKFCTPLFFPLSYLYFHPATPFWFLYKNISLYKPDISNSPSISNFLRPKCFPPHITFSNFQPVSSLESIIPIPNNWHYQLFYRLVLCKLNRMIIVITRFMIQPINPLNAELNPIYHVLA